MIQKIFSDEQKGAVFIIAAGLLYGLLGYFGMTIIAEGFSRYNMLFWRFLVASIFMFFVILPKRKIFHNNSREILKIFLFGALFHGVSVILYFASASYMGTGISMVLFFLYPVIVIFFNRLFYQAKITKSYYYAIYLIVLGLALLINIANLKFNIFGIALGLLSAIFYALYVFAIKKSKVSSVLATFMMALGCASTAFVFSILNNSFEVPVTINMWINIVAMGILCTALPVLCFLQGLRYIDSAKASILAASEPLAVIFFSYILLGERMALLQFFGAILILFGAVIVLNPLQILNSFRNRNSKFRS